MSAAAWDIDRPWERQPCDTDLSWPLFQRWLLAEPRTMRVLDGSPFTCGQLEEVAWKCHWKSRAAYWDEHIYDRQQRILEAEADKTAILNARMFEVVRKELDKLGKRSDQSGDFGELKAREIIRMAEVVIKTDLLVRGQVTERVAQVEPDLSRLTLDELRVLRSVGEKVRAA